MEKKSQVHFASSRKFSDLVASMWTWNMIKDTQDLNQNRVHG